MKRSLCISIAFLLLAATACENGGHSGKVPVKPAEPIVLTTRQAEKAAGDNAFAFGLFRQIAASDDKTNAFISPLSVTMALGMLYNGTSTDAGEEMAAALGMAGFTETEINEYYQKMAQALLAVDPLTALSIANSIWSKETYPVEQAFIDINKTYYDAEVQSLDFSLPSTVDAINDWCAAKTNGKIETIIDRISPGAVMYLINAVYFKSKWKFEFDKADTRDGNFNLAGGEKKTVPMMYQRADLSYYESDMLTSVEMPYGNGAFSMVLMLPAEDKTVDEVVEWLDADEYAAILDGMRKDEIRLTLPRFRQECKFSLIEPVKELGMKRIFFEGGLMRIADDSDLMVCDIMHKTFVEVNEEGTEAAAVTGAVTVPTAVGSKCIFDRPFIYLIREKSTGAILFIGRMDDPQS